MGGISVLTRVGEAIPGLFNIRARRRHFSRHKTATISMSLYVLTTILEGRNGGREKSYQMSADNSMLKDGAEVFCKSFKVLVAP